MTTMNMPRDCYEVVTELDNRLRNEGVNDYYVVGGLALGPMTEEGSELLPEDRTVRAAASTFLPTIRENGTRRDIDVLVLSPDESHVAAARKVVESTASDTLEVSVFGIDRHEKLQTFTSYVRRMFTDFLSQRTVDEAGVHRYVLGPIEQPVSEESYQPWTLETPQGSHIQVMHPVAQLLCYEMRSLSGPRAKDSAKLAQAQQRVLSHPDMEHDLETTFAPWQEFILARDALLWFAATSRGVNVESSIHSVKGRLLRIAENDERIVTIGQHPLVQTILKPFVRS